ncbi:keratin, type II cytoskeletal 1b-like [Vitis riparia]|uniref:keratin, type II cytoskeletal 1b-like n=1 Tax=Vitis riparia TaxID=96939 RepID=UPI00155A4AA3|nr:keratin, type II cytoskeletal 1b-like [Vitis riparia]
MGFFNGCGPRGFVGRKEKMEEKKGVGRVCRATPRKMKAYAVILIAYGSVAVAILVLSCLCKGDGKRKPPDMEKGQTTKSSDSKDGQMVILAGAGAVIAATAVVTASSGGGGGGCGGGGGGGGGCGGGGCGGGGGC